MQKQNHKRLSCQHVYRIIVAAAVFHFAAGLIEAGSQVKYRLHRLERCGVHVHMA